MKTSLLRLLFAAVFACGAVFAQDVRAQDFIVDGIQYYKTSDNTCEIMGAPSDYIGDFVIPESVEYASIIFTVTGIRSHAFYNCDMMSSVTIPNTVTYIGDEAFNSCTRLTSIVIPESVTSIGESAFDYCYRLTEVEILGNIEIVSEKMFHTCRALKTVKLPESVKRIDASAFSGCEDLEEINLTSQLAYIEVYAFSSCSSLKSIVIPNTVTRIGMWAFSGCTSLEAVTLSSSMTDISSWCFHYCQNLNKVVIPESITSISQHSFQDCSSLKTLKLPSTISYIGDDAFKDTGLYSFSYLGSTQAALKYRYDCGVSDVEKVICVEEFFPPRDIRYYTEEDGMFVCEGLQPGEKYYASFGFRYGDGKIYDFTMDERSTSSVSINLKYEYVSPGELHCYVEYNAGDADVTWAGFTDIDIHDGSEPFTVEGDTLKLDGLEPGRSYNINYTVIANDKECEKYKIINMPELELTTLPAKATSNTVALICAETNLPDTVGGTGFEWRRYDAPEEMPSSTAACPVIDGVLTGSLNNLSPSTYYKFRPYYKAESGKMFYGEWVAFITADAYVYFDPTVRTYAATGVTETTADVSATAVQGSDPVTEQGFEYWPTATRAAAMRVKAAAAPQGVQTVTATGQVMTATLEGLQPGTGYTFRAYVKTAKGTTYGGEQTFSTQTATGLSVVPSAGDAVETARYDAVGRKIDAPVRGLNIVVMSDGSVRKVIVK